ncbi:MAG: hypothetical protein ACLVJO_02220 [[Clostridium] scindens]
MFYKEEYDRQKVFECMIGKKGPKESVQESKAGSRIIFQAENIQNDYFDGLDFAAGRARCLASMTSRISLAENCADCFWAGESTAAA